MTAIYFDRSVADEVRRGKIYDGAIFVYSSNEHSLALCNLAAELLSEAFGGLDPRHAQHELEVREYAAILAQVKPKFIHHPECKRIIPRMLEYLGCDLDETHFDVPRMRSATSHGYLTTGIAYAFHPHRDTWYSAPMSQVNWWMPIYEVEEGNVMAFHPRYWSKPVRNDSQTYNYQEWNATSRFNAAQHIGKDTRTQPRAQEEIDPEPSVVIVTPPGAVVLFSGAQLHSTVNNETGYTRFSIDFRVVNRHDLENLRGARNVDSRCTGSAINDYLRGSDLSRIPEQLQQRYMPGHPQGVES